MGNILTLINVANSTKTPIFEMESSRVADALASDNLVDYSYLYQNLINNGLPILVYAGEFDAKDGPIGQAIWMKRLSIPGSPNFWS